MSFGITVLIIDFSARQDCRPFACYISRGSLFKMFHEIIDVLLPVYVFLHVVDDVCLIVCFHSL